MFKIILATCALATVALIVPTKANTGYFDFCTTNFVINTFAKDPKYQSLIMAVCGPTLGSQEGVTCGNSANQFADLLVCAIASKSCGVQTSGMNELTLYFTKFLPDLINQVPELKKFFENEVVCGIVEQACCISASQTDADLANLLLQVSTGKGTIDIISEVNNFVNNLFGGKK